MFQDFKDLEKNGSISQISLKRVIKSYCRNENSPNNAHRAGLTEAAKRGGTSTDTNNQTIWPNKQRITTRPGVLLTAQPSHNCASKAKKEVCVTGLQKCWDRIADKISMLILCTGVCVVIGTRPGTLIM